MAGQPTIASFFAPAPSREKRNDGSHAKAGAQPKSPSLGIGLSSKTGSKAKPAKRKASPSPLVVAKAAKAVDPPSCGEEEAKVEAVPEVELEEAKAPDCVGKRIRVWWSSEREWYTGTVAAANKAGEKVRVDYDDGDVEWVTLGKKRHEFLEDGLLKDEAAAEEKTKTRASKRRKMALIAEDDEDDEDVSMSEEDLGSDSDYCGEGGQEASDDEDEDEDSLEEEEALGSPRKKKPAMQAKKVEPPVTVASSVGTPPQSQNSKQTVVDVSPLKSPPKATGTPTVRQGAPNERAKAKMIGKLEGSDFDKEGGRNFSEREAQRFKFLQPDKIKDASGRKRGDPLYDPSTLQIPQGWFKQQKISPGQQQWWTFKSENFDSVLLFKMGKFYEMYEMDAHIGVEHLGLQYMKGEQPHCGFPEKAYAGNAEKLARKGYKIVVVEQTETPEQLAERNRKRKAKGQKVATVVNREKVAVLSPGTLFDYEMVRNTRECSYVVSIAESECFDGGARVEVGVSAVDVTTGKMILGQLSDNASRSKLNTFLTAINPVEVIIPKESNNSDEVLIQKETRGMLKKLLMNTKFTELIPEEQFWNGDQGLKEITPYFEEGRTPQTLQDMEANKSENAIALHALGGMVCFLQRAMLDQAVLPVCQFEVLPKDGIPCLGDDEVGARLDASALANLEIVENSEGAKDGTLLSQLDHCASGPGHRMLREWLLHPLKKISSIVARQQAVEELRKSRVADDFQAGLRRIPDLERSLTRMAASSVGSGREREGVVLYEDSCRRRLRAFLATLRGFDNLKELVERVKSERDWESPLLKRLFGSLDWTMLEELKSEFDWAKAERDGQVTPRNFPSYTQSLEGVEEVEEELGAYLNREKAEVYKGINWVKDSEMEVPEKTDVPRSWELTSQRKGKGAVRRYQTKELREILQRKTLAEEKVEKTLLEYLRGLMVGFCKHHETWQKAVEACAKVDVLCSLSLVAEGWCQPTFVEADQGIFKASSLSHPSCGDGFVPNDLDLGGDKSFALLTGPNMGGKSTIMRQVCLATILAQIGAHVPAESCTLTPMDAIFVRMGARDSIFTGQSTWNVELSECNSMLQQATPHSLVVLDEFGRGTATSDGIALAAAVMKWLINKRCLSLFSTHYHLLASEENEDIMLWHMACEVDEKKEVTFLYKIRQGVCPSSFGVNVAKLAGIPETVLERAREVIDLNESSA
ncbi:DNA mismatch repair protein MSH6 [Chloropicon primus]|uniref:DNA mismatch repair protein n=1 Tax=Chloropicon primus TaxID=1764295 RepID=A0A5B8MN50_9CHLO|nr:DNA mismatch repair protein MSH6 [Chloropicon primus]UPQ99942.1 DNA mismatch repair protein MSH6 [Chloropicon primus]|mmetsp:Transcript_1000/g.2974  ORF Transcript_1000/g.2974 Transcript_1000/m.2974 type:complete len:1207 (-) Transcript_1000:1833-5453(-)|eukprot:QDZ20730.1 DNA mismatch repair protein MSH6 [Chloropicon primus]